MTIQTASNDVHAFARALYQDYLSRKQNLSRHREYARKVADATSGSSTTPVKPLATMGKNGGPLLCDVCHKPMILEGGGFQGVFADEAWKRNPKDNWNSYISGGMVVLIESNGTLRVYHGYPTSGCARVADLASDKLRAEFRAGINKQSTYDMLDALTAYFKAEMPENDNDGMLSDINKVLFTFDPGLGVNCLDT